MLPFVRFAKGQRSMSNSSGVKRRSSAASSRGDPFLPCASSAPSSGSAEHGQKAIAARGRVSPSPGWGRSWPAARPAQGLAKRVSQDEVERLVVDAKQHPSLSKICSRPLLTTGGGSKTMTAVVETHGLTRVHGSREAVLTSRSKCRREASRAARTERRGQDDDHQDADGHPPPTRARPRCWDGPRPAWDRRSSGASATSPRTRTCRRG